MPFDFSTLVTDRTQADVDAGNAKGSYNAADLNRVDAALEELYALLQSMGYLVPGYMRIRIDRTDGRDAYTWYADDKPAAGQLGQYLANVAALRAVLTLRGGTPGTPETMSGLTYAKANDIERILAVVDEALGKISAAWYYSGDLYSGEL